MLDQSVVLTEADRVHAVPEAQFGKHVRLVSLAALAADGQLLAALGIREAGGHQEEDLARGEPVEPGAVLLDGVFGTRASASRGASRWVTDGSMRVSAIAATRIAVTGSSGGRLFSTKPLTPEASAR
ncbi:MAG: hypothetical protein ABW215_22765 [Kibdelosporangium sp.]